MATEPEGGTYLYAVIGGTGLGDRAEYGEVGLDGAPVYVLGDSEMAALVSRIGRSRLRPERRNLAVHSAVLKRALAERAVLPMTFGLIASGDDAVRDLLRRNRRLLGEQMARVEGRLEMGLRVLWDVPNVFEYFVAERVDLRDARDALGDVRAAGRGELLALGQLFERALNEERERHFAAVEAVLMRHGLELRRNAPRGEREVMNLACLVPRALQGEFEGIVSEAAAAFDSHFTFDINGPWAPHNFIELKLQLKD